MKKTSKNKITNLVGWYGVAAILLVYTLTSFDIISHRSLIAVLLNLTGSVSIIFVAVRRHDTQPAVLNIVWALIALIALARLVFF